MLLKPSNLNAQDKVDSLTDVLKSQSDPESRAFTLMALGNEYFLYSNDTAIFYYDQSYILSKRTTNTKLKAEITYKLGLCFQFLDPIKCAEYTLESVQYSEDSGEPLLIAYSRNLLGNLYRLNGELDKAMKEYSYSLQISEMAGDSLQMSRAYNNLGIIHMMKSEYDIGIEFWFKSLEIKLRLGEEEAAAATMSNIALYYKDIGRYYEAKDFLDRALAINKKNKDYESISFCYTIIGDMYWRMDNPSGAVEPYKMALAYADTINAYYSTEEALIGLSRVLDSLGRHKEALFYHRKYTDVITDLHSESNQRIKNELTTQFETEKREKENLLLKGENEAKDARIELEQANVRYLWIGLALAFAILLLIIFVLSRVRAAKVEIEKQKNIVEEKNQEITDSISYAKRLQSAILPTDNTISTFLPNNFVLYLPKDIVAGDFYWMEHVNNKVLLAVADCTGHGVPGALVSVVCHNALNRAVREFGLEEPGLILDKVTDLVIETFEKSAEEVKDGMDICLCSFDVKNRKLQYAGANNSLYVICNGNLLEYKADKQPIGKYARRYAFTTHNLEIEENSTFYLSTDGFADQFGGDKGKKMKYKPFKEVLVSIHQDEMSAQRKALQQSFENWRGDYEQIDDVCVIGVRIPR